MTNKHNPLALQPGWAIYLRTSDAGIQNTKNLQERQRHTLERTLLQHSPLPVIETYADVESGLTPNRPEYQQLLHDAQLGKFSHIAVASPDRFGRDPLKTVQRYHELADLGISVQFAESPESSYSLPPSTPTSHKEQANDQEA
jgi:DNA invertase Pin-like site-specific DNA recombinase